MAFARGSIEGTFFMKNGSFKVAILFLWVIHEAGKPRTLNLYGKDYFEAYILCIRWDRTISL